MAPAVGSRQGRSLSDIFVCLSMRQELVTDSRQKWPFLSMAGWKGCRGRKRGLEWRLVNSAKVDSVSGAQARHRVVEVDTRIAVHRFERQGPSLAMGSLKVRLGA